MSAAFTDCENLETAVFTNCITINILSFSGCKKLKSIELQNVQSIGQYAFSACSSLETIKLPSCEVLSKAVFNDCSKLASIFIPKIREINSEDTFYGCSSLKELNLTTLKIVNGNSLDTFYKCNSLQKLYFGEKLPEKFGKFADFSNFQIILPSEDSWKNYLSQCEVQFNGRYVWYGYKSPLFKASKRAGFFIIVVGIPLIFVSILLAYVIYAKIKERRMKESENFPKLL